MSERKKILESSMKIRFHDCDPFNHLNNYRYLDYIVTARGDQLIENYDFDIYKLAREKGLGWVSAQTQISYWSPALLMEEVVIQTRLIGCTEKYLNLEALMWNATKSKIKAVTWTKLVHYNLKSMRSHLHDDELMQFFRQIVHPLEITMPFEERIQNLKQIQ